MGKRYWIYDTNYKHYRNSTSAGTVFATTRALDFAPVFADPHAADLMVGSLFDDCRYYEVKLWAFVVMPTHIHVLVGLHDGQSASSFMGHVKSNSGKRVGAVLSPSALGGLGTQSGLGRRMFWQRGFRSVPIDAQEDFATKVDYMRLNPIKAGICKDPSQYRWSSAWMVEAGYGSWERGLELPAEVLRGFANEAELSLWSRLGNQP